MDRVIDQLWAWGADLIGAIVVLIIGLFVMQVVGNIVRRSMSRRESVDQQVKI